MTKEQEKISASNWRKAWDYFISIGEISKDDKPYKYSLHHKDWTLKHTNIERYILWLPEDLILMTKSEHAKLHWQIAKDDGELYKEWCRKYSEAHKGKHHTEESKKLMSEKAKGRHHSEEARRKISDAKKDKPLSEAHKNKISESCKGKSKHKGEHWKLENGKRVWYTA